MSGTFTGLVGVLVVATMTTATPQAADVVGRVAPVLPSLKISGKTDGEAKLVASVDFVYGLSPRLDLFVEPRFEIATKDGAAKLFTVDDRKVESGSSPWRAGAQFGVAYLAGGFYSEVSDDGQPTSTRIDERKAEMAAKCVEHCRSNGDQDNCKKFKKALADVSKDDPKSPDYGSLGPDEFCTGVVDAKNNLVTNRDLVGAQPIFTLSGGARIGRTSFKFYRAADRIEPDELQRNNWDVVAAWSSVPRLGSFHGVRPIVEAYVGAGRSQKASSTNVEACAVHGQADARPVEQRMGAPDRLVDVESCETRPLNAPSSTRRVHAGLWGGVISAADDRFKLEIGAAVALPIDDDTVDVDLRVELPLDLALGKISEEYAGEFKGIVRIIPTLQHTFGDDPENVFLLNVQLATARSLVRKALDYTD